MYEAPFVKGKVFILYRQCNLAYRNAIQQIDSNFDKLQCSLTNGNAVWEIALQFDKLTAISQIVLQFNKS